MLCAPDLSIFCTFLLALIEVKRIFHKSDVSRLSELKSPAILEAADYRADMSDSIVWTERRSSSSLYSRMVYTDLLQIRVRCVQIPINVPLTPLVPVRRYARTYSCSAVQIVPCY